MVIAKSCRGRDLAARNRRNASRKSPQREPQPPHIIAAIGTALPAAAAIITCLLEAPL
jgi:hypothetical protein